jgi:hypothetical protein
MGDEAAIIFASGGHPRRWIRWQLSQSSEAWTAIVNGIPVGMWGVTGSEIETEGMVWAAFTDLARRFPLTLLRGSKAWVEHVMIGRLTLTSLVRASDLRAQRFARHLGFTVWEDEPMIDSGVRCFPIIKVRP